METQERDKSRARPVPAEKQRVYFCIDMKCFYASVECADRGLDPFTTPLVVADEARGQGAICLAVSPALKALGVKNRCRLFEVPAGLAVTVAKPRMKRYMRCAAEIYGVYLRYMAPEDIHVYSIDEAFLDVTDYLKCYHQTAEAYASFLLDEIAKKTHIPATVGIGSNLYLAKIALDITAKKNTSHIARLDEESYRETLWRHEPLTDFWQVSTGTAKRLEKRGIFTMRGIALAPETLLYQLFGVNAELLIDHAWGRESCTIADIKKYKSKSRSVSSSQILFSNYPFDKARLVVAEMARAGAETLMRQKTVTRRIALSVGYADDSRPADHGAVSLSVTTDLPSCLTKEALALFDRLADRETPIRRLSIAFPDLESSSYEGYDLFSDVEALEKERKRESALLGIKDRFGKNALLRAVDYLPGATARERNRLIGGHNGE